MIDLFLDLDVVCKYLNCNQGCAVQLILDLIMKTVRGVEVDVDLAMDACNRQDLTMSLKFHYCSGMDMLVHEIPARIRWFFELIGNWPSLNAGGCRCLLQAKDKFIHQMEILMKMKFDWLDGNILPALGTVIRMYARLGVSVDL